MVFTEDKEININDLKVSELCYVEYERHDDIVIELALKLDNFSVVSVKNNKVIKEYIALYSAEDG